MSNTIKSFISAFDEHQIAVYHWPQQKPKQVVHILHGMSEYAGRYEPLALYLNSQNIAVIAHDHRGHGESTSDENRGHFADNDGWRKVLNDVATVQEHIIKQYPETPVHLLGHSMGSFVALDFAMTQGEKLSGLILSGSNYAQPFLLGIGYLAAKIEQLRQGKKGHSNFIDLMAMGQFNAKFKPQRTPSDWLSRDNDEVDKYIAHPFCGHLCSNQYWLDVMGCLKKTSSLTYAKNIPSTLPVYLLSGDMDPVGQFSKGVMQLKRFLKKAGIQDIHCDLYSGGRHEILNETNKATVYENLNKWLILNE